MNKTLMITLSLIIVTAGCAKGETMVLLKEPKTEKVVECKGDPWANWNVYTATEACAKGYEKIGYVRVSSY